MSKNTQYDQREVSYSQFRDHTIIHQGNIQGNVYHGTPPSLRARDEVVRIIPYPRNEHFVNRPDLTNKVAGLLPPTPGHWAALWGLGGSGKTQIALDYAYQRGDEDAECYIFWVHADSEVTFLADYKTIGKKLGVIGKLEGVDLLEAVCGEIEKLPKWVLILDNADDLGLFGVGQPTEKKGQAIVESLFNYVPRALQGTVLWTSRDAHIGTTLVESCQGIEVPSMAMDEATMLLAKTRGDILTQEESGARSLLEELQYLPLAISQAGAYMQRTSITSEQYLGLLRQGKTRWEILKKTDKDRYRRPEVSNSVLETWNISIQKIRTESEMSYQMLHIIAYVDNQDIPQRLLVEAAARRLYGNYAFGMNSGDTTGDVPEIEVLEAITRLKEFSFLRLRMIEDVHQRYEMHKLVQEAIRYTLCMRQPAVTMNSTASEAENDVNDDEPYYCGRALRVVDALFPASQPASWAQCEQYLTHAIQVSEWAEVGDTRIETGNLLAKVSIFLRNRGRWKEKESIDVRALGLRKEVLGEKHPDTIQSTADLAATYHHQGRYEEAKNLKDQALTLRREVLGDRHPDTIRSMASLATACFRQGKYDEAELIYQDVLKLQKDVSGERDASTTKTMASLATTYHYQRRYDEAEKLKSQALAIQKEVCGEDHPDTVWSMSSLATTYHEQRRYHEAELLNDKALKVQKRILGEKHPHTLWTMASLATVYHSQCRYKEALLLHQTTLELRKQVLGDGHPDTLQSTVHVASAEELLKPRFESLHDYWA